MDRAETKLLASIGIRTALIFSLVAVIIFSIAMMARAIIRGNENSLPKKYITVVMVSATVSIILATSILLDNIASYHLLKVNPEKWLIEHPLVVHKPIDRSTCSNYVPKEQVK